METIINALTLLKHYLQVKRFNITKDFKIEGDKNESNRYRAVV